MTTKFCFEVPLPHLMDFHPYQDYMFALSFLCSHLEYMDYLKFCKSEGLFMILDNSFNELDRPDDPKLLGELYHEIHPDLVIAPDADYWSTEELMEAYAETCHYIPKEKVLLVVRSDSEYDLAKTGKIPYAIPYEFRPYMPDEALYNAHFLGYLNPQEIEKYQPRTCDTTMPTKLALLDKTYREWLKEGCIHYHSNTFPESLLFNPLTEEQLLIAFTVTEEIKSGFKL